MLSKREWEQLKSAIENLHRPILNNSKLIYRGDVLELLEHWVEEERECVPATTYIFRSKAVEEGEG